MYEEPINVKKLKEPLTKVRLVGPGLESFSIYNEWRVDLISLWANYSVKKGPWGLSSFFVGERYNLNFYFESKDDAMLFKLACAKDYE